MQVLVYLGRMVDGRFAAVNLKLKGEGLLQHDKVMQTYQVPRKPDPYVEAITGKLS